MMDSEVVIEPWSVEHNTGSIGGLYLRMFLDE